MTLCELVWWKHSQRFLQVQFFRWGLDCAERGDSLESRSVLVSPRKEKQIYVKNLFLGNSIKHCDKYRWKMCIAAVINSIKFFATLLPWVQPSVQRKYDLQKNEKYCVLGGKKSNATRRSWKQFSNPLTVGGWRGGEGCSLPVAHQSGRSTISNISGNSLDLFVNVLRVFWILTVHWGRRSAPHLWEGLDRPHCMCITYIVL